MKMILDIDIKEHYKSEFDSAEGWYTSAGRLDALIKEIESEENPIDFKEQLLAITQLYFDSILDYPNYASFSTEQNTDEWAEQSEALDNLILAGKKSIGSFYQGDGIDFDEVKEIILPYADKIIEYNPTFDYAKTRHLRDAEQNVQRFGIELQKTFDNTKPIDTLVCIASGGFEPSFLAMDIIEKEELAVVRYSNESRDDQEVKVPIHTPEENLKSKIKDKTVLVIEDIVYTGMTLAKVMKYASGFMPNELYGIAVERLSHELPGIEFKPLTEKDPFIFKYMSKSD